MATPVVILAPVPSPSQPGVIWGRDTLVTLQDDAYAAGLAREGKVAILGSVTAPVISNIATLVTGTTVTITYTTDVACQDWVEYGLDTSYGSTEAEGGNVTSHSVILYGLTALTTYHFRVAAIANGTVTTSADGTFTTE